MNELDVKKEDTEKVEGKDETGYKFTRYISNKIPGKICLSGANDFQQEEPRVIFQKIIYDGLLGSSFMKRYLISYDIARSRMIFQLV